MSKFNFWSVVSNDQEKEEHLLRSILVSQAVWDPNKLTKTLNMDLHKSSKKTKEEILKETKRKMKSFRFRSGTLEELTKKR